MICYTKLLHWDLNWSIPVMRRVIDAIGTLDSGNLEDGLPWLGSVVSNHSDRKSPRVGGMGPSMEMIRSRPNDTLEVSSSKQRIKSPS